MPTAVCGNRPVLTSGVFRMYGTSLELRTGAPEVGVFTTLGDAIEWVTA
jgi:hypothetical protein